VPFAVTLEPQRASPRLAHGPKSKGLEARLRTAAHYHVHQNTKATIPSNEKHTGQGLVCIQTCWYSKERSKSGAGVHFESLHNSIIEQGQNTLCGPNGLK